VRTPRITARVAPPGLALALALILGPAAPATAQKKAPDGAKVLILSGGQRQHHGYREQALYLAGLLEDTGRYEATLDEDAAILESPAMAKYDLLINVADRRTPETRFTVAQQNALLDWVKGGHGYVSIHGADNAAVDWVPGWREMLGGVFSHYGTPDGRVSFGSYRVHVADPNHPVTRGLADFDLKDELYYYIQMEPGVEPLATVDHEGGVWPVAWTRTYGRGRVFHTPLGHRGFGPDKDDPLRDPNLGRLVLQGVDWVAAGPPKAAAATPGGRVGPGGGF